MIPHKYERYAFAFFMSLLMSCLMSFVISVINVGLVDGLGLIWLRAWGIAWLVAFPAVIVVAPVVRRLVHMVLVK